MRARYRINEDRTISSVPPGAIDDRPWFISLTAATAHSGASVTCFTKEGIRATAFRNPLPDPDTIFENIEPERRHYFVQMTEDGELHVPPLMPEEAAHYASAIVREEPPEFEFSAPGVIPRL